MGYADQHSGQGSLRKAAGSHGYAHLPVTCCLCTLTALPTCTSTLLDALKPFRSLRLPTRPVVGSGQQQRHEKQQQLK